MKIIGTLFAAVMLSSTLVVGLSIRQPKYTTRQAQEVTSTIIPML